MKYYCGICGEYVSTLKGYCLAIYNRDETKDQYYHKSCYDKSIKEDGTFTATVPSFATGGSGKVSLQEAKPSEECGTHSSSRTCDRCGKSLSQRWIHSWDSRSYCMDCYDDIIQGNAKTIIEPPAKSTEVKQSLLGGDEWGTYKVPDKIEKLSDISDYTAIPSFLERKLLNKIGELMGVVNKLIDELDRLKQKG